jgi:hypothetical protein
MLFKEVDKMNHADLFFAMMYRILAVIFVGVTCIAAGTRHVTKKPFGILVGGGWSVLIFYTSLLLRIDDFAAAFGMIPFQQEGMSPFYDWTWQEWMGFGLFIVIAYVAFYLGTKLMALIKLALLRKSLSGTFAAYRTGRSMYKEYKSLTRLEAKVLKNRKRMAEEARNPKLAEAELAFRDRYAIPPEISVL